MKAQNIIKIFLLITGICLGYFAHDLYDQKVLSVHLEKSELSTKSQTLLKNFHKLSQDAKHIDNQKKYEQLLQNFSFFILKHSSEMLGAVEKTYQFDKQLDTTIETPKEPSTILRSQLNDLHATPGKAYTSFRAVPYFSKGKRQGMKVLSVKPQSLLFNLGIKRGDIVKTINKLPFDMSNPQKAAEILKQVQETTEITIELTRIGEELAITSKVVPSQN